MKCKYCGSEMDLMEWDDVLGYKDYYCENEECNAIAIIDERYDHPLWDEGDIYIYIYN